MLLMIDNYDSFTYNLVQYLQELGQEVVTYRNDAIDLDTIKELKPERIVISPGPGEPKDAGISEDVIRFFGSSLPILGVCLGHQAIGEVFGGEIVRAGELMHGKISQVQHDGKGVFAGLPQNFKATRYHSLVVKRDTFPAELEITAWTDNNLVMGLHHRRYPIYGVQFHPESILTEGGKQLLQNFIDIKV